MKSAGRPLGVVLASIIASATIVGGCSTIDISSITGASSTETTAVAPDATKAARSVVLQPVVGPSDAISQKLVGYLDTAITGENISMLVDSSEGGLPVLTGYVVAKPEARKVRLTYVWDITGADGNRIDRITGNEVFPVRAGASPDAWDAVPSEALQGMSRKVASALAASGAR